LEVVGIDVAKELDDDVEALAAPRAAGGIPRAHAESDVVVSMSVAVICTVTCSWIDGFTW
jgi:hypothetical protein